MAKKAALLDLPVSFGDVGIGERTARVGVSVSREELSLSGADKQVCGRRLIGKIVAKDNGAHGDQGNLSGFEDAEVMGAFDVKRIGVTPKDLSFNLAFNIEDIDVGILGKFAQRNGRLIVGSVEKIPAKEAKASDEDSNGEAEE